MPVQCSRRVPLNHGSERTGKVKRLRRHSRVRMAPCTARGKLTGAPICAVAYVLPVGEASDGLRALEAKYGCMFTMLGLLHRVQRQTPVVLEIVQPDRLDTR